MNKNINLIKILKECPKGTKLYSTIFGEVKFIECNLLYQIIVAKENKYYYFTSKGEFIFERIPYTKGECIIFPSKDQRDWSKFTAPWLKKEESIKPKFKIGDRIRHKETNKDDVYEISKVYDNSYGIVGFNWGIYMKYQDQYELVPNKFDPKTLKTFDKVLGRNYSSHKWTCNLFSNIIDDDECMYHCIGSYYRYCIPYNDDTKHLVGTTDEAPDLYKYWKY